jgi:hypothetical protein
VYDEGDTTSGRPDRKKAQSIVLDAAYAGVGGKKATAAVREAADLLKGQSGLTTEAKVDKLKSARKALKVATASEKVDDETKARLEEARQHLKKALKVYA